LGRGCRRLQRFKRFHSFQRALDRLALPCARPVLLSALFASCLFPLASCRDRPRDAYQGYVEAELTYVASPLGGRLLSLAVERGREVAAGEVLFELESVVEAAARDEAADRLNQAGARLANLRKGARPTEILSIEARLAQAQSALELSSLELARYEKLYQDRAIAQSRLDQVRTRHQGDRDRVKELAAALETARLGARSDEILMAEQEVEALTSRLEQATWTLEQKKQAAPLAGRVLDTFFTAGEWVPPGRPVAALLVPGNLKVRFFVPEPEFSGWRLGEEVSLACDGCPPGLAARVSFLSPQVEFTPPVIYSKETRSKLVFLLEASPDPGTPAAGLHPGQPVEVRRSLRATEAVPPG